MIEESLLKSNFIGKDGFVWWIGQVADPKVWRTEKSRVDESKDTSWAYRCKVRIIGYHSFDANILPDEDLPWAHILTSASEGSPGQGSFGKTHMIVGGESVLGFFLDGEEGQQPVVVSCFYRSKAVENAKEPGPFKPFTGMQGNLKASATRIKAPATGVIKEAEKNTVESGSAIKFSQNPEFGIGDSGLDLSPNFNPLTPDTGNSSGSFRKIPGASSDELFYKDVGNLAFLKAFNDAGEVSGSNGCLTNVLANITSALQGFIGFVNGLEKTIFGFIDPIRNKIVDIGSQIKSVARLIASLMKFIINGMRDNIIKLTGCLFRAFSITIPLPQWLRLSEAAKRILDIIFCIFEKLFGPIENFIAGLLSGLIGKTPNIPRCAAEELTASLISKLMEMVDDSLATVLSGLDWLVGGVGEITGYLKTAAQEISQLLSFLNCDGLLCQTPGTWDPFKGVKFPETDEWAKVVGNIDLLGGYGGEVNDWIGLLSSFGSADTPFKDCRNKALNPKNQKDLPPIPPGTLFYKCIPPEVIINGDGTGAKAIPVIEPTSGSILTVKVLEAGKGYSRPPSISILDNSNYGSGAEAKSTIKNGQIESIYIVKSGSGYCLTDLQSAIVNVGVDTTSVGSGTGIGATSSVGVGTTSSAGISTVPVGIITSLVVESPGFGYTSGDTILVGSCVYSPILTTNGSIIGINSVSYCSQQFKTVPPVTINTTTGVGAEVYPVLQYIPQYIVNNQPTTGIGSITEVVECV